MDVSQVPVYWSEPFAIDASGGSIVTQRSHTPGQLFPVDAVTRVTYTFADEENNKAVCNFSVQVTQSK